MENESPEVICMCVFIPFCMSVSCILYITFIPAAQDRDLLSLLSHKRNVLQQDIILFLTMLNACNSMKYFNCSIFEFALKECQIPNSL